MAGSWLLDVPAQQPYIDGILVEPVIRAWEFYGMDVTYNATTKRIEVRSGSETDWKQSVRAATTAALPNNTRVASVITADANGALAAQDGVTLVVGDRFLIKNEVASQDNGPYTVTSLGGAGSKWSMTRSLLADESDEVTPGLTCYVEEGTAHTKQVWRLTSTAPITLNTTPLLFEYIGSTALVTAIADGTVVQLGAANTVMITDGATAGGSWALLGNANWSAAGVSNLAGGKVTPAFGSQNISAAGNLQLELAAAYVQIGLDPTSGAGSAASAGAVRLQDDGQIIARNAADGADYAIISADGGDGLTVGGPNPVRPGFLIIDAASSINLRYQGGERLSVGSSRIDITNVAPLRWHSGTALPKIYQNDLASAGGTGNLFTIQAQTITGGGGSTGAGLDIRGGNGDTGGAINLQTGGSVDAVRVDDDGAHTFLGMHRGYTVITDAASPYAVAATDHIIYVDSSAGVVTIDLPAIATSDMRELIIKDIGNASTNAITIDGNAAETIDGALTVVFSVNYAAITLRAQSATEWGIF